MFLNGNNTLLLLSKGGIVVMAFNNNNNFNNSGYNNNNNQGDVEKKKTNFRIGRIYGSDGILDVVTWISDTGVRGIFSIKSAVGKDPSTGNNVYEQKKPNELPRFFMTASQMNALIECIETAPDLGAINIVFPKPSGDKLTIVGQGSQIKITIEHSKTGSRTITLESVSLNNKNIHADFKILLDYLKIIYKKAIYNKLDPEEFGMVAQSESSSDNEDVPF